MAKISPAVSDCIERYLAVVRKSYVLSDVYLLSSHATGKRTRGVILTSLLCPAPSQKTRPIAPFT